MHYEHFKQRDPRVLKALVENFPFATITANGPDGPVIAYAPLTFRQDTNTNGIVEFHLAKENPITPYLTNETKLTIVVNGPSASISPSWYTARFPTDKADRSETAPTYNYISANIKGSIQVMDDSSLVNQISDLVKKNQPTEGWKIQEIDPVIFSKWRGRVSGFRIIIESFDLTAKLSQEQNVADRPGIISGLQKRAEVSDLAMAEIIEIFDGTPESLVNALHTVGHQLSKPSGNL